MSWANCFCFSLLVGDPNTFCVCVRVTLCLFLHLLLYIFFFCFISKNIKHILHIFCLFIRDDFLFPVCAFMLTHLRLVVVIFYFCFNASGHRHAYKHWWWFCFYLGLIVHCQLLWNCIGYGVHRGHICLILKCVWLCIITCLVTS